MEHSLARLATASLADLAVRGSGGDAPASSSATLDAWPDPASVNHCYGWDLGCAYLAPSRTALKEHEVACAAAQLMRLTRAKEADQVANSSNACSSFVESTVRDPPPCPMHWNHCRGWSAGCTFRGSRALVRRHEARCGAAKVMPLLWLQDAVMRRQHLALQRTQRRLNALEADAGTGAHSWLPCCFAVPSLPRAPPGVTDVLHRWSNDLAAAGNGQCTCGSVAHTLHSGDGGPGAASWDPRVLVSGAPFHALLRLRWSPARAETCLLKDVDGFGLEAANDWYVVASDVAHRPITSHAKRVVEAPKPNVEGFILALPLYIQEYLYTPGKRQPYLELLVSLLPGAAPFLRQLLGKHMAFVHSIVRTMQATNPVQIQLCGALLLHELTEGSDTVPRLAAVATLIRLLQSDDDAVSCACALALAAMCDREDFRYGLLCEGLLPALGVKLAGVQRFHGSAMAQNGLFLLRRLCATEPCPDVHTLAAVIPALSDALARLCRAGVGRNEACSGDTGGSPSGKGEEVDQEAAGNGDVLPHPPRCCCVSLVRNLLWTLVHMWEDEDGGRVMMDAIMSHEGAHTLATLCAVEEDTTVTVPALRAVGAVVLLSGHYTHVLVHQEHLVPLLVRALTQCEQCPAPAREAMWVLSNVAASGRDMAHRVVEQGAVPAVVAMARVPALWRPDAMWALYHLSWHATPLHVMHLVQCGCLEAAVSACQGVGSRDGEGDAHLEAAHVAVKVMRNMLLVDALDPEAELRRRAIGRMHETGTCKDDGVPDTMHHDTYGVMKRLRLLRAGAAIAQVARTHHGTVPLVHDLLAVFVTLD